MRTSLVAVWFGFPVVAAWAVACSSSSSPAGGVDTDAGIDAPASDDATEAGGGDAGPRVDAGIAEAAADAPADAPVSTDASDGAAPTVANAVYTMSNAVAGNQVFGFSRAADGTLTPMAAPFATGGTGTGASLGEQGALAYDRVTNRLYVVNAGDNSFSIFPVHADGTLGSAIHVATGAADGSAPTLVGPKSVTFSGNTVYVLFEGNPTTASMIAGWTVTQSGGQLAATAIAASAHPLSSGSQNVDPAQIEFSPDGKWLIVTEKQDGAPGGVTGAGSIDSFSVDAQGNATKVGSFATASAGVDAGLQMTPYGFGFYGSVLVVSEAGSTGVGTYTYADGTVAPVTGATQFLSTDPAPCWVAVASDWAYVANAQGPDISGYTVAASGGLSVIGAVANAVVATTGKKVVGDAGTTIQGPTDETVSADGQFLYVLNSAVPSIGAFKITTDGTLTRVGGSDFAPGGAALPTGAVGIAAR